MNNYNCSQSTVSQPITGAILGTGLMMAEKTRAKGYTTSKPENWRQRWLSQPNSKESQEQRWRRQGKLQ